jgi:HAD superfamily hydrolase (TIGR01549 family)
MRNTGIIRHIWFDFGGTLFKETPEFIRAHDDFRFKVYADLQGVTDPETAKSGYMALYQKHGSNSAVFRSLGQPSDYWMKQLDQFDFTAYLKPDAEVSATIMRLKEVLPLSLFTNFIQRRIDLLLDYLSIPAACFTHVLSGDDITERKPALDGFYAMIERSGIPADQILYIGDRVDVDVKPAKQVGIMAGLVYGQADEADYCFTQFRDITGVAKKL